MEKTILIRESRAYVTSICASYRFRMRLMPSTLPSLISRSSRTARTMRRILSAPPPPPDSSAPAPSSCPALITMPMLQNGSTERRSTANQPFMYLLRIDGRDLTHVEPFSGPFWYAKKNWMTRSQMKIRSRTRLMAKSTPMDGARKATSYGVRNSTIVSSVIIIRSQ